MGVGVALVVMWAGVGIARDTLEPLIGEAIDPEVYEEIKSFVESYDGIEGTHDLIVHNYGPGRSMASIHAEVPNDVDIEQSHEIIDRIERDTAKKLGIFLVIHMDPVEMKDQRVLQIRTGRFRFFGNWIRHARFMIFVWSTEKSRLTLSLIWLFLLNMMKR